jgi:heat shock protein HtpX
MPYVFEVEAGQPNAFAVGANPKQASIVLTSGLRTLLYGPELEAIIAHEIAHIKSRDTLAATIGVSFLDAIVSLSLLLALVGIAKHSRMTACAISSSEGARCAVAGAATHSRVMIAIIVWCI